MLLYVKHDNNTSDQQDNSESDNTSVYTEGESVA